MTTPPHPQTRFASRCNALPLLLLLFKLLLSLLFKLFVCVCVCLSLSLGACSYPPTAPPLHLRLLLYQLAELYSRKDRFSDAYTTFEEVAARMTDKCVLAHMCVCVCLSTLPLFVPSLCADNSA